jgi:2-hydroxymuconate-semialdehyde hydrolase
MSAQPATNTPPNPEIGKSVRAAGLATNYHDAGAGPPVVLMHGSGPGVTAYANWRMAIPPLAAQNRVLALDVAGFGYTERDPGAVYDMDYWVGHVLGFLDALGLPRVNLIGNSFGGALALALAARHPERVDRVVMMGAAGTHFKLTPGLDAVWGYQPSLENMRRLFDVFVYDKALVTEDLLRSRYQASMRPGSQETYASLFPAPRQRHVDRLATPEDKVRAIDKEVLLIHGRDDLIVPLESSLKLLQMLPRAQLHVFSQCGHWTQVEKTARFCRLVGDFLSEGRN